MGCKAVVPVCCVMHIKEPRTLIVKEKGLAPVFLDSRLEHTAGWICARYKSSVLLLLLLLRTVNMVANLATLVESTTGEALNTSSRTINNRIQTTFRCDWASRELHNKHFIGLFQKSVTYISVPLMY